MKKLLLTGLRVIGVSVCVFANGFDYRGEWKSGFGKYYVIPSDLMVRVVDKKGNAVRVGKVQIINILAPICHVGVVLTVVDIEVIGP